jgi:Copper transport outer membrane protein, MctB
MGYSARYHVASLAAIFLALAVGILIGAGLGDDLVRNGTANLESSLKGDLSSARDQVADLERDLGRERQFSQAAYPALVGGQLRGERIAVVAFGGLDGQLGENVRNALAPTGARISEVAVVAEPPDSGALENAAGKRFAKGRQGRGDRLSAISKSAGRALVQGGPLYERLREALLSGFSGKTGSVDGVIVVRSRPGGLDSRQDADSARVEDGMIDGMAAARVPVVGVQRTDTDPSSVGYFESRDLSTVDDIDLVAGQVAAVYALAGAQGNFGLGGNADSLLPQPLTAEPGTGR